MKLAIHFPNFTLPGSPNIGLDLAATARAAEDGGCSTFTVMDHWFQMEELATSQDPMLEGYTTLGFLAGVTRTHHARSAGDRGHLPPPRAAGQDGDHARRAVGGPGPAGDRGRVVRARAPGPRACPSRPLASGSSAWRRRCRSACRCGVTTTAPTRAALPAGRDHLLAPPHPAARGRPILIGGSGEQKTLRLVARYADACNLFARRTRRWWPTSWRCSPGTVMRRAATRPTSSGPSSWAADPLEDEDGFLAAMEAYAALGISPGLGEPGGAGPGWVGVTGWRAGGARLSQL